MPTHYDFVPKPEVADWIDKNIDSWTTFCYDNIYRMQRKQYQQRLEKISFRILIVLLGMVLLSFSYITINIFNYYMVLIGGSIMILIGFIMFVLEVYNGKQ